MDGSPQEGRPEAPIVPTEALHSSTFIVLQETMNKNKRFYRSRRVESARELNAHIVKVPSMTDLKKIAGISGETLIGSKPEQLVLYRRAEITKWAHAVSDEGAGGDCPRRPITTGSISGESKSMFS